MACLNREPRVLKNNQEVTMTGTILVGIVSVVAYFSGVPLLPLIIFIIVGSFIEYRWIGGKRK